MRKIRKIFGTLITIALLITLGLVAISIKYPIGYKNFILKYSQEYEIDPYLVASVINVESKYDKNALSIKEAKGLMQIGPQTGQWAAEVLGIENYHSDMLYEPEVNIRIGTWYLNTLFKEFDGDLNLVLAAYNAGSGNVNKWLQDERYSYDGANLSVIPFKETEDYITRINNSYKIYSRVYKTYILNPSEDDTLYINLIHNIRKIIIKLLRTI